MNNFLVLNDSSSLLEGERKRIGGKAHGLNHLYKNGFKIPHTIVMTNTVFNEKMQQPEFHSHYNAFISMNDIEDMIKNGHALQRKIIESCLPASSKDEMRSLLKFENPTTFSVRSSAICEDGDVFSFAGRLDSFLDVEYDDIEEKILLCWCSLFNESVAHYLLQARTVNSVNEISMAVIIQPMIMAEASGVAFSINPVTGDTNEVLIEAISGYGDALVAGVKTPSVYRFKLDDITPLSMDYQNRALLPYGKWHDLCAEIKRLAVASNNPVDVEWCYLNDSFYFLQCRSVTSIPKYTEDKNSQHEYWWSDNEAYWQIDIRAIMSKEKRHYAWNRLNSLLLITTADKTTAYIGKNDSCFLLQQGACYLNTQPLHFEEDINNIIDLFAEFKIKCNTATYKAQSNEDMISFLYEATNMYANLCSVYRSTDAKVTNLLMHDLSHYFSSEDIAQTTINASNESDIYQEISDWNSLSPSKGTDEIIEHINKYPWAAQNHTTLEAALKTLKHRPITSIALPFIENSNLLVSQPLKKYVTLKKYREKIKLCWASFDALLFDFFLEVSIKSEESREDIAHFYRIHEIAKLLKTKKPISLREKQRRLECHIAACIDGSVVYHSGKKALRYQKSLRLPGPQTDEKDCVKGTVASYPKGNNIIVGTIAILLSNDERTLKFRQDFVSGQILVMPMTQFTVLDLIVKSAAVITDEGGVLSHASIICRELNKPCVVGCGNASISFKNGDLVSIDLETGFISRLQ